jgi:hypothetical protein
MNDQKSLRKTEGVQPGLPSATLLDANVQQDICGLCGKPGADKFPHPMHWPGERIPETDIVHSECERLECEDAFVSYRRRVGEEGITRFLRSI